MGIGAIVKEFKRGNVCVTGLRGRGKDMLFANVVARRKKDYISNVDYKVKAKHIPFKVSDIDTHSTYKDIIDGKPKKYVFPYKDGTDLYISDVGVYFPSQYCNELNRDYKPIPVYMALSRQLSDNNVHINVQNLNRAWDKIREQSDTYIYCRWCKVLFGKIVIQSVTLYDCYDSCLARMQVPKVRVPLMNRVARTQAKIYLDTFKNTHGTIKNRLLIYWNKSNYDTRVFKTMFEEGVDINGEKSL